MRRRSSLCLTPELTLALAVTACTGGCALVALAPKSTGRGILGTRTPLPATRTSRAGTTLPSATTVDRRLRPHRGVRRSPRSRAWPTRQPGSAAAPCRATFTPAPQMTTIRRAPSTRAPRPARRRVPRPTARTSTTLPTRRTRRCLVPSVAASSRCGTTWACLRRRTTTAKSARDRARRARARGAEEPREAAQVARAQGCEGSGPSRGGGAAERGVGGAARVVTRA